MPDILAVLGRGMYQVQRRNGSLAWKPTALLEMYDNSGRHPVVWEAVDDSDPRCLIGGGNANVIAGLKLFKRFGAKVIVFAYGHRSSYLREIGGPTEGDVMLKEFCRRLGQRGYDELAASGVELYGGLSDDQLPPGTRSDTFQELRNILNLALQKKLRTVLIVTVRAHVLRATVFLNWLLAHEYEGSGLICSVVASEDVLLLSSRKYWKVVRATGSSEAMIRTTAQEQVGTERFQKGLYTRPSEAYDFSS